MNRWDLQLLIPSQFKTGNNLPAPNQTAHFAIESLRIRLQPYRDKVLVRTKGPMLAFSSLGTAPVVVHFDLDMTDTIIQSLKFDERGLIPAILQDAATSEIVALCYLDSDALARTLQTGQTEVGGRDEIGMLHRLVDVHVNSDGESLTVLIEREERANPQKRGVSLMRGIEEALKPRTAEVSLVDVGSMEFGLGLNKLYGLILKRKENRPEGSYTSYLFNSGLDKILKKVAEESGEVIIAAKNGAQREIVSELADLFYHLLVLMADREVKLGEVNDELARRAAQGTTIARKSDEDG